MKYLMPLGLALCVSISPALATSGQQPKSILKPARPPIPRGVKEFKPENLQVDTLQSYKDLFNNILGEFFDKGFTHGDQPIIRTLSVLQQLNKAGEACSFRNEQGKTCTTELNTARNLITSFAEFVGNIEVTPAAGTNTPRNRFKTTLGRVKTQTTLIPGRKNPASTAPPPLPPARSGQ